MKRITAEHETHPAARGIAATRPARVASAATSDVEFAWLHERRAADAAWTGGKAANLARLAGDYPVPPGFVVAGPAGMRPDLADIRAAYAELGRLTGTADPPVAVRSSAVDEDGADASFAGQHESYLNVTGPSALASAICETVQSFTSDRALEYRRGRGLDDLPGRVAVLVQWLVPADSRPTT